MSSNHFLKSVRPSMVVAVVVATVTAVFGANYVLSTRAATVTTTADRTGDLNADGRVNVFDLSILLNNWYDGPVATATPAPTATPGGSPSGQAMPANAPTGWVRVFGEEFTTNQARGTWPGAYADRWYGYDCDVWNTPAGTGCDTSKAGRYDRETVVSAAGGVMDYYVHTEGGIPRVAGEGPKVSGAENHQRYGRYSVRWRSDSLPLYKNAWLLWPASNVWNEGEIDYPEGDLNGIMEAYNHCPGDPSRNCANYSTNVGMSSGWHTSTIEWKPGSIEFFLDGNSFGRTTSGIPTTEFRWVLQTETNLAGTKPAAATQGHLEIDWVTIDRLP